LRPLSWFCSPVWSFVKRSLRSSVEWVPEKLLKLFLFGLFTTFAGLMIYGFTLECVKTSRWAAPLVGLGLFVFGQEIVVTVLLAYMTECYRDRAVECTIVFQFPLNLMCFPPLFFTPLWIAKVAGAKVPYVVYALLTVRLLPAMYRFLLAQG
jgi:hypothetical protein